MNFSERVQSLNFSFMLMDVNSDRALLALSKTKIAPLDAIIVPRVNLRIPEETDSIWSASIKISPSSSKEER